MCTCVWELDCVCCGLFPCGGEECKMVLGLSNRYTHIFIYVRLLDKTFFPGLRDAGVIWVLLLIGHLYLIGAWLGDDRRTNTIKKHGQKRLDYVFNFYELIYSQQWTKLGGPMYLNKESINMQFQSP
jgi:hypothetical protein